MKGQVKACPFFVAGNTIIQQYSTILPAIRV